MGAEMSYEHKETNGTRIDALYTENLSNDGEPVLPPRRTSFKKTKMKRGCGMKRRLVMDGHDQVSSFESS